MDTRNRRATASRTDDRKAAVGKASVKMPTCPFCPIALADRELSNAGSEVAKSLSKRLSSASSTKVLFADWTTGGAMINA